jgi:hypothetical protein
MSDHDNGPYTPPSDRLSFDPREPVRSGGPAPVTLIVSGVVLVAIIGAVFLIYSHGTRHKTGDTPAAVGTSMAQIKTAPSPDANAAAPPRLTIDRSDITNTAGNTATLAPEAEQPLPRPLPVQAAPIQAQLPPAAPAAASAPPVAPAPAKPVKPLTIASLTDAALSPKAAPPKPVPAKLVPKPPVEATAAAAPKPTPISSTAAAPPTGGGWVQIGAYSSADLAAKGWSDTAKLEPAGMAGKGKRIESVERDGKTLYRAYVTGFTHDGAESFCGQLKAAGKACFVK